MQEKSHDRQNIKTLNKDRMGNSAKSSYSESKKEKAVNNGDFVKEYSIKQILKILFALFNNSRIMQHPIQQVGMSS